MPAANHTDRLPISTSLRVGGKCAALLWFGDWLGALWMMSFASVLHLAVLPTILIMRKQFLAACFFVALSPMTFFAVSAAADYVRGQSNFRNTGWCPVGNVDCVQELSYNWTYQDLSRMFGPPRHAFISPNISEPRRVPTV